MEKVHIALLGLGTMNGAVLQAVLQSGVAADNVVATARTEASAEAKSQQHGVRVLATEGNAEANAEAVANADVVFVGVLPRDVPKVCAELASSLPQTALVVSVAAGVTVAMLEAALPAGQPVVRSMPNTPISLGNGVIGMTLGAAVTEEQRELLFRLLDSCGDLYVLEESQMDALNAVAGSGPGYLYYLAENVTEAGVTLGLDREVAAKLAAQTLAGAAKLLRSEVEHDAESARLLREEMWLPGGTTKAAYEAFDRHDMAAAIQAGVEDSGARAAAITQEIADDLK